MISDLNGYIRSRHFLYSDMVKENLYPRAKSLYLSVDVFFSLACIALFSLCSSRWILGFRLIFSKLVFFFFSRKNLPANWKGVLFHETWQGFDVAFFYWSAARPQGHAPKWGAKLWIARGQILKVCFLKSNLFLNQFMGCVDLYDFHENYPRS